MAGNLAFLQKTLMVVAGVTLILSATQDWLDPGRRTVPSVNIKSAVTTFLGAFLLYFWFSVMKNQ
jgi:hypothetical protein